MSRRITFLLKIIASIVLLALVVRLFGINRTGLIEAFSGADKKLLLVAFALSGINLTFQISKWHYVLRLLLPSPPLSGSIYSLLGGITLGLVTPARIGEIGRAFFLTDSDKVKLLGLTLLDKAYSLIAYFVIGLIGITFFVFSNYQAGFFLSAFLIIVICCVEVALILLVWKPSMIRLFLSWFAALLPRKFSAEKLAEALPSFNRRNASIVSSIAALSWLVMLTQFWILISAFQYIPFHKGMIAAAATQFTKTLLPLTAGELGIREAASIHFFGAYGIKATAAFEAALLLFLINVMIPGIIGLIFLPRLNFSQTHDSAENEGETHE